MLYLINIPDKKMNKIRKYDKIFQFYKYNTFIVDMTGDSTIS